MPKTTTYLRVSKDGQDLKYQKLELFEYADSNSIKSNEFLEVKISSRKSTKEQSGTLSVTPTENEAQNEKTRWYLTDTNGFEFSGGDAGT